MHGWDVLQLMDGAGVPGTAHVLLEPEENMATRALLGQGILIAVIELGVEYTLGTEYTKAEIDEVLRSGQRPSTQSDGRQV